MFARPHPAFRLLLPFALVIVIAAAVLSLTHARAQPLAATYMHGAGCPSLFRTTRSVRAPADL